MQVAKWGNSLAVRLPSELVQKLGLKEGDHVDLHADDTGLSIRRHQRPEEVLANLRRFRGSLPASDKLSRSDANDR